MPYSRKGNSPTLNKTLIAASVALLTAVPVGAAELEEIIVTAQKREQTLRDVPISLDVFGADQLSTRAINDTVSLALASPSLSFQEGFAPTASNFAIRGVGSLAFEGGIQPSVSFVVDGVPLGRVSEFIADLGDIERVEVLNGPQGTLYGRNATAGAVNVVRARPTQEFEGYVEQSLTDDDESITRVMASGPLSDGVRGRLSGFYKDRDGHIENLHPGGPEIGGEESWGVLGKLDIDLSDNANLLLSGEYRDSDTGSGGQVLLKAEDGGLGMARLLTLGGGDLARGQGILRDPFKGAQDVPTVHAIENYGFSADLTLDLAEGLRFKSITGARGIEINSNTDVDVTPANGTYNPFSLPAVYVNSTNVAITGSERYPIFHEADYVSQEFRLEGSSDRLEWIGGLYYSNYEEVSQATISVLAFNPQAGGSLVVADPREGKAEWDSYAAFGDVTFHLTDSLNLFAGLRWTVEDLTVEQSRVNYTALNSLRGYQVISPTFTEIFPFHQIQPAPGFNLPTQSGAVAFERDDRSEDWSGRLGIAWDLSENVNTYASISRGFIGSGANYSRTSTRDTSVLDPSIAEAIEIGVKSRLLDNSLDLNGAVFWQEVDDLQSSGLIPGTIQTNTFNAGNLRSSGVEVNATWAVTDMLTLAGAATWLDTEIDDLLQACYFGQTYAQGCNLDPNGNPTGGTRGSQQDVSGNSMVLAPELSYNASARLDFPLDSLPFSAYAMLVYTWTDDIQYGLTYDPLLKQEDYQLLDLFIGIEDKQGRYQVSVFGKNLTDDYFDTGISEAYGSQGRVVGRPPRDAQTYFGLKARYNF
ncbi:MAG: TonB-dependent receptor [Pseudomonadota bacterium]|nr:TonB-dependent receptor [Pseudomonadota bacterium]